MSAITVKVTRMPWGRDLPLPDYETEQSAGMDLAAAVVDDMPLLPGARALVPTGLCIALPSGYEAQIRPRSGLAMNYGVTVLNTPGTIDADYRGEIKVILANFGPEEYNIRRGTRIAQMVFAPVLRGVWDEVAELPESERGDGGFGSTGT